MCNLRRTPTSIIIISSLYLTPKAFVICLHLFVFFSQPNKCHCETFSTDPLAFGVKRHSTKSFNFTTCQHMLSFQFFFFFFFLYFLLLFEKVSTKFFLTIKGLFHNVSISYSLFLVFCLFFYENKK